MAIFKHKIGKLGSPNKKQIKNNQFNMISGEMALSSPTRLTDKRHTMYQFTNDFYINLIFFNKKVINYNNLNFLFLYLNIVFK